jgi:hypothetical protein
MKLNIKDLESNPNPDLLKERTNSNVDIKKLTAFFGKLLFASAERHKYMIGLSKRQISKRKKKKKTLFFLIKRRKANE